MPKPVVKEGKIVSARGKFYVVVGRSRTEIPAGLANPAGLKKIAGEQVPVTFYGKSIVAVGRSPSIVCYAPAADVFKVIQPDLQEFLQKKYTEAGILPG